ncbi:MAG: class I SAM-dependent methyltransferase [Deltaproteobacteria bacterium]|nr:class I SAM-dependent methyltransferase [Deltaproteobacteria bacterium]
MIECDDWAKVRAGAAAETAAARRHERVDDERKPGGVTAHYTTPGYLDRSRWLGFHQQFTLLRDTGAREILEIGPGTGVVSAALRACGLRVVTVDIDPGTRPDVVADVRRLAGAFPAASFDAVAAFEVLEHLAFDDAALALEQMAAVTRSHAVVSVPYSGMTWHLAVRMFTLNKDHPLNLGLRLPAFWRRRPMCDEHQWEPGLRDRPLADFRRLLARRFEIEREELLSDTLSQVFFVLQRRQDRPA